MKKVLLINDSMFENIVMKDMLEGLNFKVDTSNEYNAEKQIENFKPEIIIVNLIMKDITGNELINKIKAKHSDMYCLLCSSNNILKEDYLKDSVDEVIHIPVNKEDLKSKVLGNAKEEVMVKFCPYCGNKLNSGVKKYIFCPYCGQKI